MATNKKAISAYLPTDLEEYLTQYCTEYNITRKDKTGEIKPALGTAIVEILRVFFSGDNVPSPLPDNVPLLPSNVVTEDRLQEILSKNQASNVPIDVPSNVATQDDISKVLDTVPSIVQEKLSNVESNLLGAVNEKLEQAIANRFKDISIPNPIPSLDGYATKDDIKNLTLEIKQLKEELSSSGNKPTLEESEPIEQTGKLLSGTDEAYKLACSRGFEGKLASFRSGINRANTAQDYREKYGIVKLGDRQQSKYYDVLKMD